MDIKKRYGSITQWPTVTRYRTEQYQPPCANVQIFNIAYVGYSLVIAYFAVFLLVVSRMQFSAHSLK